MIRPADVLALHDASIREYGGSHGLRDEGLFQSALARPFQTFDGTELYPSTFSKAAALGESLIVNHPFVDGNKRTGALVMEILLLEEGYSLQVSNDDFYDFIIAIATGTMHTAAIAAWLEARSVPLPYKRTKETA